jgi:GxxExxY protein
MDLIYPELSYQIVGALFDVFNEIGGEHYERNIQSAIAVKLRERGLSFKKEFIAPIMLAQTTVGHYRVDFLVEDKVVLEIKRGKRFAPNNFHQLKTYLNTYNLPLGILALFTNVEVKFARVVNFMNTNKNEELVD